MLAEAIHLAVRIGGRPVLEDVSLSVREGEICGLLGPNGAGKSTTIAALTGLRPASGGSVSVLGLDPRRRSMEAHRAIGVLSEHAGCYEWMSAGEYLGWFGKLYGRRLTAARIIERLARVGLHDSALPVGAFSRGMKQRLGLARALVNDPRLLILDEPTNGLDPRGRREIHDVLLELAWRHRVGILLCTHLLDDVDRLCNRIVIIDRGRAVLEGALPDLLSTPEAAGRYRLRMTSPEAGARLPDGVRLEGFQGDWREVVIPATSPAPSVWRRMLDDGWPIGEIHQSGSGLESLYLRLVEKDR